MVNPENTDKPQSALAESMRALADTGHPDAAELRAAADAFDLATDQLNRKEISIPKFVGIWAKARKLYTEKSGKGLLES